MEKQASKVGENPVSRGRHEHQCRTGTHSQRGDIDRNDGEFAEVLTIGIDGIEKDLMLETIQLHRCDTGNTPEEFQRRFPVGMRLRHRDKH